MNSARKVLTSIIAIVALAGSLAGCSPTDYNDEPVEAVYQSEGPALVYTDANGLITKYIDPDGTIKFDEGYTSADTEHKSFARTYIGGDSLTIEDSIEIEGVAYPVSSTLNVNYSPLFHELIPLYNELAVPKMAESTPGKPGSPYNLDGYSIQEIVSAYAFNDIQAAVKNGELPEVQYTLTGKATIVTDANIAQAQRDGVSARDAYQQFVSETTYDTSQYFYSNICASYGVQPSGMELATALSSRFPTLGATFSFSSQSIDVRAETEQPCSIVEATTGEPVKDPNVNSGTPNTYIAPPED